MVPDRLSRGGREIRGPFPFVAQPLNFGKTDPRFKDPVPRFKGDELYRLLKSCATLHGVWGATEQKTGLSAGW